MRRIRTIAVATVVLLAAACQNSLENNPGSIVGKYNLVAVDGAPLPFTSASAVITGGSVDLRSNGRFTLSQLEGPTSAAVTEVSVGGSWSLQENALALLGDNVPLLLGIVARDSIRMTYRGHTNVYLLP